MMSKVLVIEDDRIMRENTVELLKLSGYEVASATNGKEGIARAHDFLPDLIICDIMMPELDGYGVLHILNKEEKTAGIPFIFITAKSRKEDMRKGMDMGADDFLTKPFQDIELINAVESRIKRHEIVKKRYKNNTQDVHTFFQDASELLSLKSIKPKYQSSSYRPKEIIYRSGDDAYFLYFIDKGKVKTYRLNDDGKEFITANYQQGDFFGYQPLLEERGYDEYAEVIEECKVYKILKEDFIKLIYENKEVASKFIKLLSKNLSNKEEQLVHLAYSSVRKRVVRKLLELDNETGTGEISISRTDLASMVGTSKETLVRSLTEMREDHIIKTEGSKIILLDKEKLKRLESIW